MGTIPKPITKKVTFYGGEGMDALGSPQGKPQVNDVVKVHCEGFYIVNRPLLTLFGKKIGASKKREKCFFSTHTVGDTCFVDLPIPKGAKNKPTHVNDILAEVVRDMVLGEGAEFEYDFTDMEEKHKALFIQLWHPRAHFGTVPYDALSLRFQIDVFRFSRQSENKEIRRKSRNGTGARIPGAYSGGP